MSVVARDSALKIPRENAKVNLSKLAYDEIKSMIMELRVPPGATLDERSLASGLDMSRTPVREALGRLAQDGWVVWRGHRSPAVPDISMEDVEEIFMMRNMIETFAAERIFDDLEPRLLAGLLVPYANRMKRMGEDNVEFMKEDMAFHSCIVDFVGSRRLTRQWELIRGELTRIAIYAVFENRSTLDICAEHEAMIDAFWREDRAGALSKMSAHRNMIIRSCRLKVERDVSAALLENTAS
jgi:DNA-binding GntR family transcriptional regulator